MRCFRGLRIIRESLRDSLEVETLQGENQKRVLPSGRDDIHLHTTPFVRAFLIHTRCIGPAARRDALKRAPTTSYSTHRIQEPVSTLYWALVSGTTESLPWRTRGESANSGLDLIWASDMGLGRALPALIFTWGPLGLEASTETTAAVPTAVLWSPVS